VLSPAPEHITDLHTPRPSVAHRCEASAEEEEEEEDLQENTEGHLQIYPEGRAFQCHPGLGTYTLTLPSNREKEKEREGGDRRRSESRLLTEEVEELQRLVHIHRELKVSAEPHLLHHLHECTQCCLCCEHAIIVITVQAPKNMDLNIPRRFLIQTLLELHR